MLAISSGLSPSTESDQEADSLLTDTSSDEVDSDEVGGFVLGTKNENSLRLARKRNRAVVWSAIYRTNSSEKV